MCSENKTNYFSLAECTQCILAFVGVRYRLQSIPSSCHPTPNAFLPTQHPCSVTQHTALLCLVSTQVGKWPVRALSFVLPVPLLGPFTEAPKCCCEKTAGTVWTSGNFSEDRETCQTAREKGSHCVDLFSLVYGGKKYFTHN